MHQKCQLVIAVLVNIYLLNQVVEGIVTPLTELGTMSLPGGKASSTAGWLARKAVKFTAICEPIF
jgi:hypothetical protein